jgi:sodium/hydrogen exchanger-like protein 6/7
LLIFADFLYLFFFSLAIGILFGLGISYFLKRNESFTRFPIKETSLILLTGYSSYLFSELLNLSGIISLFTCSVIMGHYCYLNISEESQRGTVVAFDTVGYLAEAFVFAYLGICILGIDGSWKALGMAALLLLVLPLARAVAVYILPLFYLICRSKFPLENK